MDFVCKFTVFYSLYNGLGNLQITYEACIYNRVAKTLVMLLNVITRRTICFM